MDLKCKECGKVFRTKSSTQKFCSRSCSASYNNRGISRKKPPKPCIVCGKPCNERHNKHCDGCIKRHVYNICSLEQAKTDRSRRQALIRSTGHACSVCKNTKWNGKPIPIELDHINGSASDNSPDNLRLICPNCHAQTSTYKGKNKGKSTRSFYVVAR